MKKLNFMILLFLAFASMGAIANPTENLANEQKFDNANKFYKNGDFKSSLGQYLEIYNTKETSELDFNIGNCYFRERDFAKAILFYERAKLLTPNDIEIEQNLQITQLKIQDKIEAIPEFQLIEYLINIRDSFAANAWALLTFVSAWLVAILFFLFYLTHGQLRKLSFFGIILLLFAFSFNFSMASWRNQFEQTRNKAIITSISIYMKSAATDSSQNLILIHSGTKVEITEENGDYVRVRIVNGNIGWINKKDIELI